jgi:dihydroorotase
MTTRPELVLTNVTLPDGRVADITVGDGLVRHIGAAPPSGTAIDCTGLLVLPGAADIHVHMRGGAQAAKEDWRSGTMSALAGGVTLVVDQPNTVPPLTTPERFAARVDDARSHSLCHFAINSALTADTPLVAMAHAGALAFGETFVGSSSYGDAVDPGILRHALGTIRTLDGLVTIHAETVHRSLGSDLAGHDRTRPVQGEAETVRKIRHSNPHGCRLHFCHLSSAAAIGAAAGGSFEVTPHHLFLSRESFADPADTCGKVNPPLRTEKERKALWSCWDRIPVIASDHAPHTVREKQAPFPHAPSGIPGVETLMPLLVAKVLDKTISISSLIEKTATNPATLLGIQKAGFKVGNRADFALYRKRPVRIRADDLHSRCGWTPYGGMPAVFPETVIMGGEVVFSKGEFHRGSPRWFAGNRYRRT